MHCIVKYRPSLYDDDGIYTSDEWISISDIGNSFDGKELTLEEYINVENRYVNTILDILSRIGAKYLTIGYLELNDESLEKSLASDLTSANAELRIFAKGLKSGQRIGVDKVPLIIRLCLREYIYAVLVNLKLNLQIEFGYDYYMYVHTLLNMNELHEIASSHCLYLNPRH